MSLASRQNALFFVGRELIEVARKQEEDGEEEQRRYREQETAPRFYTLAEVLLNCTQQVDALDTRTVLRRLRILKREVARTLGVEAVAKNQMLEEIARLEGTMLTDSTGRPFVVDERYIRIFPRQFMGVSNPDARQEPQFAAYTPNHEVCSVPLQVDDFNQEVQTSAGSHPLHASWFSFEYSYGTGRTLSGDEPKYPAGNWNRPTSEDPLAATAAMFCFILAVGLGGTIGYGLSRAAQWLSLMPMSATPDGIAGSIQHGFEVLVWLAIVLFIATVVMLYTGFVSLWAMGESANRYSRDRGFYVAICWLITLSCGGLFVVHCFGNGAKYEALPPLMIALMAISGSLVGGRIAAMIVDKAKSARESRQEEGWRKRVHEYDSQQADRRKERERMQFRFSLTTEFRGLIPSGIRDEIIELGKQFEEVSLIQAEPAWTYSDSGKAIRLAGLSPGPVRKRKVRRRKSTNGLSSSRALQVRDPSAPDEDLPDLVCLVIVRRGEDYWAAIGW